MLPQKSAFTPVLSCLKIGIHLDGVYGLEGHDGVARVDGTDKGVGVLHADYVGYRGHVQLGSKPGKFVK